MTSPIEILTSFLLLTELSQFTCLFIFFTIWMSPCWNQSISRFKFRSKTCFQTKALRKLFCLLGGGGGIQNLAILEVCFNKKLDCLITRVLLYYGFLLFTLEYFPIYIMVLRFQTPWVKKIAGAESTRRQRQ